MSDAYTLDSKVLPPDARVAAFRVTEGLSQLYRISVGVLTAGEIELMEARGQAACLTVHAGEDEAPFLYYGMIVEAALRHAWAGQSLYEVLVVPRVWALTLSHHCRVFVDRTVPEIIETLLDDSGLPSDGYELRLEGDHEPHFHTCQYKESRWAFICRLMEREGLYYYFEHTESSEKLIITDHRSSHEPLRKSPVRYVPLSGPDDAISAEALHLLTSQSRSLPQRVKLRDFDYLKPNLDVSTEQSVWDDASLGQHHVGEHDFRSAAEGAPKARALAEAMKARELTFVAQGRVYGLRSGYTFKLEEHPVESFNVEYTAVAIRHQGVQAAESAFIRQLLGLEDRDDYHLEVEAILATTQWRSLPLTPVPRVSGVERGFIDGPADSEYAQIDEHGRYKVKLHFDILDEDADHWDGTASTWIRMLQPHGGTVEGFHFPLRKNTEVMIIFLGGDPDRAVIAGAVPNAIQVSPVLSDNYTQNVVQTGGASRIEIEDQEGKKYVDISTPPQNTFIHLGEPHDGHGGYIHFNTDGNQLITIGGNRDITVGGAQNETIEGAVTEDYNAGQFITVTGILSEEATGPVAEIYGSGQATDITGSWRVEVSAATNFDTTTYKLDTTEATVRAGKYTLASGEALFDCQNATFDMESLALDVGPCYGTVQGISWTIPNGAFFNAPGGWTVNAPKDLWQFGEIDFMGAKATEVTGFSSSATGAKVEACGAALSMAVLSGLQAGYKNDKEGGKNESSGPNTKQSAIINYLAGFFSFS